MSPVRPEMKARYPKEWPFISQRIRFVRAAGRCECDGRCSRDACDAWKADRCTNSHGQPAYITGSKVILTTTHLNHIPEDCDDDNLMAMCQGCHLAYDRELHAATRAATLASKAAVS